MRAPGAPALPGGISVRLGRHTRVIDDGAVLVGGSPIRIVALTPRARSHLDGDLVTVTDAASRALADHFLDAGIAEPVIESLPEVSTALATVVVPVRDRATQLARLLDSLGGLRVIVVDDASVDPQPVASVAARHGAELVVLDENTGPAGARNAGLARVTTPFVVFVDSDVVVEAGVVPLLLRHFADPRLAMVAPRVLGLDSPGANWITRYEEARSSLDVGHEAAIVRPRSRVTWLPAACLAARVEALGRGFDATMRVAEDVDLVWRLVESRHRVRYAPEAVVRHDHRATLRAWLGRKLFYGTGAGLLAVRHPRNIAPAVLPPWAAGVLLALMAQRRWSLPVAAGLLVVTAWRIGRRAPSVRHPHRLAARLTSYGFVNAIAQGFALLLRHWWPLTAIGCLVSRRVRRAAAVAVVADTTWELMRTRPRLDPVRFALARRLDDAAYGAGVWASAIRGRSLRTLLPDVRSRR
ncbi:mycofactocin biosynthesis glycosyltransferase MftF [Agrococcus sp. SCSIO52902]|uniref:mycofactocin biosynthesis glycosyltransferase MftF n=1 Tax=Agrococcus sp. SCSIO52902 TaxID=2933290 RepID=UPI001FF52468|nr:mycofactocin biosynthesis glycosyltransferase MftF [Agrococcus sp. SCSIO52902]UOW00274.1 mycofactocin biosynthesis glycosyltransferase MftF [Agrococcus sp. SCSIO52902]